MGRTADHPRDLARRTHRRRRRHRRARADDGHAAIPDAEQITIDDRPRVHAYRILTRWPVRDYHARVEFTPHHDGTTTVRWSGEFVERIPGTGWLWKRFLLRFLGSVADNLLIATADHA
ncbi:SRPBCC family protein [Nocardia africana]